MNFLTIRNETNTKTNRSHQAFLKGFGSIFNWFPSIPDLQFDEDEICWSDADAMRRDWQCVEDDFRASIVNSFLKEPTQHENTIPKHESSVNE